MALFVDGPASTIDDLTNQDSGLLDVAETCGINATTKLTLAHEELAAELQGWLDRQRPTYELVAAPGPHLSQIVVTPALKRWETMIALSLFYRDAYFSQLVDRYQARWGEYSTLARDAFEKFLTSGLGIAGNPIPQATIPLLGSIAGPQQGGTFYACVAWVNTASQEGAASLPGSMTIADNNLMTVSAIDAPPNAIGFNVFAGASVNGMVLQNDVPLAPGNSFTYVPGFRTQGRKPGVGQVPDYVRPLARTLLRG
jgi:hypothetical protein